MSRVKLMVLLATMLVAAWLSWRLATQGPSLPWRPYAGSPPQL